MTSYTTLALNRYPNDNKMRKEYLMRLEQCKLQPAYHIQLPSGDLYPCLCEPLMEDDTKGWQTVRRCMKTCRRQQCRACERGISRKGRVRDADELEEDANLENWDDVEHYGRSTYVNVPVFEHNGSLFDIGSRF
jgi:hypothetical protein